MSRVTILAAAFVLLAALEATAQDNTIAQDTEWLQAVHANYVDAKQNNTTSVASTSGSLKEKALRAKLWGLFEDPAVVQGTVANDARFIDVPNALALYNTIHPPGASGFSRSGKGSAGLDRVVFALSNIDQNVKEIKDKSDRYKAISGLEVYEDLKIINDKLIENDKIVGRAPAQRQAYTFAELADEVETFAKRYQRNRQLTEDHDDMKRPTAKVLKEEKILDFFKGAVLGANEILLQREDLKKKGNVLPLDVAQIAVLNAKFQAMTAKVADDTHTGLINYALREAWPRLGPFMQAEKAATTKVALLNEDEWDDVIEAALARIGAPDEDPSEEDPDRKSAPDPDVEEEFEASGSEEEP